MGPAGSKTARKACQTGETHYRPQSRPAQTACQGRSGIGYAGQKKVSLKAVTATARTQDKKEARGAKKSRWIKTGKTDSGYENFWDVKEAHKIS